MFVFSAWPQWKTYSWRITQHFWNHFLLKRFLTQFSSLQSSFQCGTGGSALPLWSRFHSRWWWLECLDIETCAVWILELPRLGSFIRESHEHMQKQISPQAAQAITSGKLFGKRLCCSLQLSEGWQTGWSIFDRLQLVSSFRWLVLHMLAQDLVDWRGATCLEPQRRTIVTNNQLRFSQGEDLLRTISGTEKTHTPDVRHVVKDSFCELWILVPSFWDVEIDFWWVGPRLYFKANLTQTFNLWKVAIRQV